MTNGVYNWSNLSPKLDEARHSLQSFSDGMKSAMLRIQESACKAGLSVQEMMSALETTYHTGKEQPFSAAAANEAFKIVSRKLNTNSNTETDEFQIERFEIPNYKFD